MKVFGMVVLCAILLAGCGTSSSSSSESLSSSTVVQDVASSDSGEALNDSLEKFESLKDEAENLLEVGFPYFVTLSWLMNFKAFPCDA